MSGWTVQVAGWSIAIEGRGQGLLLAPNAISKRFCSLVEKPDLLLSVSRQPASVPEDARATFDSGGTWRSFQRGSDTWLTLRSSLFPRAPYLVARIDRGARRGEVFLHPDYRPEEVIDPLEYPLDELLFLSLIHQGGGLEVHAAGIETREQGGWLLLGHSGAGKSTAARLLLGAGVGQALSDDRIVLRKQDGAWWMFGTPWHGTAAHAMPRGCPLARVYVLSHAKTNRLVPMAKSIAAAEVLARTFQPLYARDTLAKTLEAVGQFSREAEIQTLEFFPNQDVAWFLRPNPGSSPQTISPS